MALRRLILGGTFDPVHAGHLEVALAAGRLLAADRVSLLVAAGPPHKLSPADGTPVASAEDRLAMVRLAAADHAPYLDVLDEEIRRGGVSYTVDTVRHLLDGPCCGDSLMLLIGEDQLPLLPTWHRVADLLALVPVVVARREGAPPTDWEALAGALGQEVVDAIRSRLLRTPLSPISSTEVRRRRREGRSIRCWVPDPVADYVESHALYRPEPAPASEG